MFGSAQKQALRVGTLEPSDYWNTHKASFGVIRSGASKFTAVNAQDSALADVIAGRPAEVLGN
jgi:hypothetical protein